MDVTEASMGLYIWEKNSWSLVFAQPKAHVKDWGRNKKNIFCISPIYSSQPMEDEETKIQKMTIWNETPRDVILDDPLRVFRNWCCCLQTLKMTTWLSVSVKRTIFFAFTLYFESAVQMNPNGCPSLTWISCEMRIWLSFRNHFEYQIEMNRMLHCALSI